MEEIRLGGKVAGGRVALVDDEDYEYLSQFNWYAYKKTNSYYAMRTAKIDGSKRKGVQMHREILKVPRGFMVDHRNGNGLDNQRHNLRKATCRQNQHNRKPNYNSTSRYKGISLDKGRWVASLWKNKKRLYIGSFDSEEHAALAYDLWAIDLFGEYARTNFTPI